MDVKNTLILTVALLFGAYVLAEDCPPKICETAKFKCISEDSCNGTLVAGGANCGCCPSCVPFRGEGEPCDVEEMPQAKDSNDTSSSAATTPKVTLTAEDEEKLKKAASNVCSPGLTCLQGICVVIF